MKIYILGLPGSGKTTYAKILAAQHNIAHVDLDQTFYQFNGKRHTRKYYEDISFELNLLTSSDNWIAEGVYPITELIDRADQVIYMKCSLPLCLLRQWKRFFSDHNQRNSANYGLLTNIWLSFKTVGMALNIWGVKVYKNKPRITHKSYR